MVTTIEQTNQSATTDTNGVWAKGIVLTVSEQSRVFQSVTWYLKNGSGNVLSGTISAQILDSSGTVLGTLGSIDASTLPTDYSENSYTFNDANVSTDAGICFISLLVPTAIASSVDFYYDNVSPSTTDYKGFYQINENDTPVQVGMTNTYFKFTAVYNGASGTRLPPPPIILGGL